MPVYHGSDGLSGAEELSGRSEKNGFAQKVHFGSYAGSVRQFQPKAGPGSLCIASARYRSRFCKIEFVTPARYRSRFLMLITS
ncbi:MAG TPA: hypothetical protein VFR80_10090, partial [Pyrinomonadaceae bacterium]|nr:hypothetical protein [Pyrinomonadaceae bacterium]